MTLAIHWVYFKEDKMQPAPLTRERDLLHSALALRVAIYISQRLFARSKQNSGAAARPHGQCWTAAK
jgi:hypothetical protein